MKHFCHVCHTVLVETTEVLGYYGPSGWFCYDCGEVVDNKFIEANPSELNMRNTAGVCPALNTGPRG